MKILIILAVCVSCMAGEIFIPDTCENFSTIDSLMFCIDSCKKAIDNYKPLKEVVNDDLHTKMRYCDYLIENNLCSVEKIVEYKKLYKDYLQCKMNYFQELLKVIEEGRGNVFALYKKARDEFSTIN